MRQELLYPRVITTKVNPCVNSVDVSWRIKMTCVFSCPTLIEIRMNYHQHIKGRVELSNRLKTAASSAPYQWLLGKRQHRLMWTHRGPVTHICVIELTIIGSDNGLSPGRRQAIIWNNAGLLLIERLGTHVSEISIGIQTFPFRKMHLNMSSAKWRPFCLGLNVLKLL